MNFIKEYLPLLIAITSASLAYLYARRNNNFANFYNQSKESLEDLLGPMYFRLKHIMSIEDLYEKEARLEEWFNDYNPSKVPIHKLGSQLLIKKFLILQEMFPNLGKERLEIEEEFYKELESVYKNLEKRYWSVFNSLYKDYNWYNRIINTYFTWRVFLEFIKLIRNLFELLVFISGLLFASGIYLLFLKKLNMGDGYLIPAEIMILALSVFFLSFFIMVVCEMFVPGIFIAVLDWAEDRVGNRPIKFFKKLFGFLKKGN